MPHAGEADALLIDDTGFPKQGTHSVGVARQYCGQLGKQDSCHVAVSVSLANEQYSLPLAYRLYLPKEWAEDPVRRAEAKVPETVAFATKPALALQLLEQLQTVDGLPKVVVVDAGYGVDTAFRQQLTTLGFTYVVGITGAVSVWPEGQAPLPPKPWAGRGLKPTRLRRDAEHQPLSARALAMQLPPRRFHTVTWREGTNDSLVLALRRAAGALALLTVRVVVRGRAVRFRRLRDRHPIGLRRPGAEVDGLAARRTERAPARGRRPFDRAAALGAWNEARRWGGHGMQKIGIE